jgi:hypothetical protein
MRTEPRTSSTTQYGPETPARWAIVIRRWQRELQVQRSIRQAVERASQTRVSM